MSTVASYGTWRSPITAEAITAGQVGLAEPRLDGGSAYWLEARPQEAGRTVLVRRTPAGEQQDLTSAPFNVRTRVHEYGGGAYMVRDGVIVAANFADQRLYRIDQGTAPQALTPDSAARLRYADLERIWRAGGSLWFARTTAPAARRSMRSSRWLCPAATRAAS